MTKDQIVGATDYSQIHSVVTSVATSGDASHTPALDEYFRKQFRKMSHEDAIKTLSSLGEGRNIASALHTSFWVWETLEEAVIGKVDEDDIDQATYINVMKAFTLNQKGSHDL